VGSRSGARARAQASDAGRAGSAQRPPTVLGAAAVQAVEVAGVLAASVLAGIDAGSGQSYQAASGIALTLIGIGTAVVLAFVAAGLARSRRWSRTPAVLTQLFTGIVGIYLVQGQRYSWGVPALLLAAVGFVTLFAPASLRALTAGRPASASPRSPSGPPPPRAPKGRARRRG
jgi:hypothetical protein